MNGLPVWLMATVWAAGMTAYAEDTHPAEKTCLPDAKLRARTTGQDAILCFPATLDTQSHGDGEVVVAS
jgi:hypothetical protein